MKLETQKLIKDLIEIQLNRNINQALKANVTKISKYFLHNEYELSQYDKKLINVLILYISDIQVKYKNPEQS